MKLKYNPIFLRIIFIFFICNFTICIFVWGQSQTQVGKIVVSNGNVQIKNANGQARQAKPSEPIYNSDQIFTSDKSSVKIMFTDDTVIDLGPKSSFKISDYSLNKIENRTGTFSLMFGKMRSLITNKVGTQGKVQFRSGGTVMGVRGTEFVVDNPSGSQTGAIAVMSGMLAIGSVNGGPLMNVTSGQVLSGNLSQLNLSNQVAAGSNAGGSGGVSMQKMNSEQMQSLSEGSKTEDKTFDMSVSIQPQQSKSEGGAPQSGGASMALNAVNGILSNSIQGDVQQMNQMDMAPKIPELMLGPQQLLPPVSTIPGGLVTVSVTVQ